MALTSAEQAIVDRFNAATNSVAQRIRNLIAAGSTDSPEFLAAMGDVATGLEALGAPGQPLPTV